MTPPRSPGPGPANRPAPQRPWHVRLGAALPLRYVLRRLAGTAGLLAVLSAAVFALLRVAPGDPARTLLGTRSATPQALAAVRADHHLDDPVAEQYGRWLADALHGRLGTSIRTGQDVTAVLGDRLALSAQLVLLGFAVAVALGLPLGVLAGLRARRPADRAVQSLAVVTLSTPVFAGGLVLIYVFSLMLGWLPAYGPGSGGGGDRLLHLVLPAATLGLSVTAVLVKLTRAAVVRELAREHVTFALARGIPTRRVLIRYVLRGTVVPVSTGIGLVLAYLLAGTVMVEQVFALPGLGQLLVGSVTFKDVPVVQAEALLIAALVCLANLTTDLVHPLADPRLRTAAATAPADRDKGQA
ncbi:ABC transporter permease [Actinacidiphila paucisporea]|uniref:Peptide/nickel transport system permease protein n=1 Tax=Actinacidiphila paucisporea TaxID=310782 RepID=A0A1M7QWQ1_9ACTN|nr:ABC transporter permease [Actinacidiphila paucisporea]SHN36042.1 peptide/nickel transport system permease protein [Actinacidiphila paucisporea]